MNPKIGLDIRIFGESQGGIGRYAKELMPRILELDKESHYFLFYNKKSAQSNDVEMFSKFENAKLVETNSRHYSLSEQTSFLRLLNKYNLDLAHFPNFNVPMLYNRPYVVTIHDVVHHKISGAKKSHWLHFYAYKKVIENAARKAKKIITVSQFSKKDIYDYLHAQPDKIEVIYEGASLNTEVDDDYLTRVKDRYQLNRPYFLFVGVLERKKNLVSLTRGFDKFLQKFKANMDLVIVGKVDPHYPDIKHKALDIKNSNRLVFTGHVDEAELSALYKGAHAFTTASLHEGFGLPGLEALSFGLPLIVSNIAVFNEIYDNAAIYFNPLDPDDIAEKMGLLARDAQFHEQQQKKSFERSLMFDWNKTASETLKIYQACLK